MQIVVGESVLIIALPSMAECFLYGIDPVWLLHALCDRDLRKCRGVLREPEGQQNLSVKHRDVTVTRQRKKDVP